MATAEELASAAKSNRGFGTALYRQLAAKPGNLFISPISIAGAFGPVAAGARAQTRAEIGKALRFPADEDALHRSLGSLLDQLEDERTGARVSIANALWLMQGFDVKADFLDLAKRSYDAAVDAIDFRNSPAAAARINSWVATETASRIPKLFEPNAFDESTRLVVTNAVYFLSDWQVPFDPRRTRPLPFFLADGTTRQVPLMSIRRYVRYSETETVQIVELPYKGERLSMIAVLPKKRNGLPAVEAGLNDARLDEWIRSVESSGNHDISVLLPKVQIEGSYDLVAPLKALGMKIPFAPRLADFSGIAGETLGKRLFISDVLHKTFLSIDEKGTEAAAASGVVISVERDSTEFRADHPFLALIRDRETGAILFLGRIAEP